MQKRILEKRQRSIEDKVAKGKAEENELDDIVSEISRFRELAPMQLYLESDCVCQSQRSNNPGQSE